MKVTIRYKGGSGSGNYGHSGRPGKIGGSSDADYVKSGMPILVNGFVDTLKTKGHGGNIKITHTGNTTIITAKLGGEASPLRLEYTINNAATHFPLHGTDARTKLYDKAGKLVNDWEGLRPIWFMGARKIATGRAIAKWHPDERYGEYNYKLEEIKNAN